MPTSYLEEKEDIMMYIDENERFSETNAKL